MKSPLFTTAAGPQRLPSHANGFIPSRLGGAAAPAPGTVKRRARRAKRRPRP